MKHLSPQKKYLVELYQDGEWHCSTAIEYVRDFRKRISELQREGYTFASQKCSGICGVKHSSNVHMYKLLESPAISPKPAYFIIDRLTGERKQVV